MMESCQDLIELNRKDDLNEKMLVLEGDGTLQYGAMGKCYSI